MDAGIDPTTRDLTGTRIDTLANAVYLRLMTPLGGWWADPGMGSRLHELKREKDLPRVARLAEAYARNALQPLLDDGRARSIAVAARPVRGPRVVPVHRRTVVAEPVAVGDGVRDTFGLKFRGQPVGEVVGEPVIHRTDWQGRCGLSPQARTNYAPTSDLATGAGWNVYGNSTRTMNFGYGAGPDGRSSGQFVFSSVLNDNGVQFGTTAPVTGEPWSIVSRLKNDGAADLAVRLRSQFGSMNVVVPADGAWHRYQFDLVIGELTGSSTFFRPVEAYLGGSSEGSIEVGAVFVGKTVDVGAYIANTTDSPVTHTDYTYTPSLAQISLPQPLAEDALLDADFTFDWHARAADIAPVGSRLLLHVDVVDAGGRRQTFEHPVEVM